MADYYQQWSFEFEVSEAEKLWLETEFAKRSDDKAGADYGECPFSNIYMENEDNLACFYTTEYGDLTEMVHMLEEFVRLFKHKPIAIQWADTCSKPRPDSFSGGAAIVTDKGTHWFTTGQWIDETLKGLGA